MKSIAYRSIKHTLGRHSLLWFVEGQHHSLAEESRAEFVPSDSDLIQLMDLRDSNEDALLPGLTTLEVPKLVGSHRVHTSKMQHHQFDTVLTGQLSETFLELQCIFNAFKHVGFAHRTKIDYLIFVLLPAQGSEFAWLHPSGVGMSSQCASTRFGVAFGILWALGEHHCREVWALWRATQLGPVATLQNQWWNEDKLAVQACKLLGSFGPIRQQPQPYGRNPSFHTEVGRIIQHAALATGGWSIDFSIAGSIRHRSEGYHLAWEDTPGSTKAAGKWCPTQDRCEQPAC